MPASPYYLPANTRPAYQLRFHFAWYTFGRRALFLPPAAREVFDRHLPEVARAHDLHLLTHRCRPEVLQALLSLLPGQSPSAVTRVVKGNLAAHLRREADQRHVWSRGLFLRSVGTVTADIIRRYVADQFAHHRAIPLGQPQLTAHARYHHPGDASELRRKSHAVWEYNVHFVFVTEQRAQILDLEVARRLLEYWQRVCEKHDWVVWDLEVLADHAHMFLGLQPEDCPEQVALNLMNNSDYFCQRRYSAAMRELRIAHLWKPGYYAGTAGAATTAQISAHLASEGMDGAGEVGDR